MSHEFTVVITQSGKRDLRQIHDFLMELLESDDHVDQIIAQIREGIISLSSYPERGVPRDDLLPDLRMLFLTKRPAGIAYRVDKAAQRVEVIRVFYGRQDYQLALRNMRDENGD